MRGEPGCRAASVRAECGAGFVRGAGSAEQPHELLQVGGRHVAQLPAAAPADVGGQRRQKLRAGSGDRHPHDAAVGREPLSPHETPPLQPIDEPRDVGGPRDEAGGQRQRGERLGRGVGQHSQRVVLLGRQAVAIEDLFLHGLEAVERPPEVEIGLLLERITATARPAGRRDQQIRRDNRIPGCSSRWDHANRVGVGTSFVQTSFSSEMP